MSNPYAKFLGKEDNLHISCCNYLSFQYPKALYTHPANEAKRSKFEQYKAKQLKMMAGVPDLLIFQQRGLFAGLAIELKVKPNKPTPQQTEWLNNLAANGWRTEVVYDVDQFIQVVDGYFLL